MPPAIFARSQAELVSQRRQQPTDERAGEPARTDQQAREEQWRSLMQAAQNGDTGAYHDLLRAILPVLRRFVQRRLREAHSVEDVVQEILISIHSVRHTYDPSRPIGPWLMTIAQRRIADLQRKTLSRARHEITVDMMPETFSDAETKSEQDASDIQADVSYALSTLSESQRQAVELTKLKGLSLDEASKVTGRSATALKVAVHRALKEMRDALGRKNRKP